MYYVYLHTMPNGKVYVGETKDVLHRWNNGEGYASNEAFYSDIQKYGWNNVKHEIIGKFEREIDARICEAVLTFHLNSEDIYTGYNKTTVNKDTLDMYASRVEFASVSLEKPNANRNILESSGLPISACEELINQWIFDRKNREILKDRYLNGMSYMELKEKYELSERQVKNIVYNCSKIIEKHLP